MLLLLFLFFWHDLDLFWRRLGLLGVAFGSLGYLPQRTAHHPQRIGHGVSGRLGQWIQLGGVGEQSHQQGNSIVYSTRQAQEGQQNIYIKIDEAP